MASLSVPLSGEFHFQFMTFHEKPKSKFLLWERSMRFVVIHCGRSLLWRRERKEGEMEGGMERGMERGMEGEMEGGLKEGRKR